MSVRLVIALLFAAATAEDCEDGWTVSKVAGSCYKMINGQSFWDAEAECALDGAHLTSILTDEENQFIDDMVNTKIPGKEIWVGGYLMTKAKTQFHWMDETPMDMNSVIWKKAGQPDIQNSNGSLEQGFCDALYKGICKRPIGQVAPKLETPLCDEGWEGSKWERKCYKLTPASKSGAANEYCLGLNATLASANSFLEKEFILEKAKSVEKDTDTWLGAKRGADGVFTWNDGSKWETGYWNSDLPEKPDNTKNCLLVCNHLWSATAHRYFPGDCNTEHMGMCKKPGNPKPSAFAADKCEQGWLTSLGSKSCYKMVDGTTFWAAEGKCVEEGAHLTSILTDEENQAIYGLMQKNIPNYDAWVGGILMTRGDNTQIYWMDGTPVDPNMGLWKGIPPKYDMERFCVQKNKDGVMQQSLCGAQLKGICKRPIGHAPVPLVKPVCDEGWKGSKFTGSCYKLTGKITKSGDAWEEALLLMLSQLR
ncbi:unnamed protein product, partial [Mesorhabditis spiculigera]